MKTWLVLLAVCLLARPARSDVRVFVQETNGAAALKYECTGGELVRSFALDVRLDKGQIIGIAHFFSGISTAAGRGYGIFPAAFRDHIVVSSATNANWNATDYTPVAVVADSPGDTLPGLGSSGVTLEFGGLWDSTTTAGVPPASGTLCWLQISEAAQVTVTNNVRRGGVTSASTGMALAANFSGALVDPSVIITGITLSNGVVKITFKGGELESAPAVTGPWTGTGNISGIYTNTVSGSPAHYFRVHRQ